MHWLRWTISLIGLLLGAWMAFDGARALVVGDYVTPRTGEYAGKLGPWAEGLRRAGLEPRSTPVKGAFVAFGAGWLAATALFLLGLPAGYWALVALAVASLWYAPVGTALSLVELALLLAFRSRGG